MLKFQKLLLILLSFAMAFVESLSQRQDVADKLGLIYIPAEMDTGTDSLIIRSLDVVPDPTQGTIALPIN